MHIQIFFSQMTKLVTKTNYLLRISNLAFIFLDTKRNALHLEIINNLWDS